MQASKRSKAENHKNIEMNMSKDCTAKCLAMMVSSLLNYKGQEQDRQEQDLRDKGTGSGASDPLSPPPLTTLYGRIR